MNDIQLETIKKIKGVLENQGFSCIQFDVPYDLHRGHSVTSYFKAYQPEEQNTYGWTLVIGPRGAVSTRSSRGRNKGCDVEGMMMAIRQGRYFIKNHSKEKKENDK